MGDQGNLQRDRLTQTLLRSALHTIVHERGQYRVVAGDAQPLQIVQYSAHTLGTEPGHPHQFVRAYAFV